MRKLFLSHSRGIRRGLLPDDREALGRLVANVSFFNARDYFGFELGRAAGADWVVVGRLHKPSYLFAYLMARPVHVATGEMGPELIVEIKGPSTKVTDRGARRLAQKVVKLVTRPSP